MSSKYKFLKPIAKVSFAFVLIFTLTTSQASATGLPTVDLANLPVNIGSAITSSQTAVTTIKEFSEGMLAKMLKKIGSQVALNMTQQVINWGSTGFKGNPFFVRDQQSFYKSIADEQVEAFVNEISADETAFPYSRNISMNLITDQVLGNSGDFKSKLNFSLDETIGPNWEDFTEDDFSVGGWDGWMAYTQNDANNPVGAYLRSAEELENRVDAVKNTTQTELAQSGGFLSMKKCVQYKDGVDASGLDPLGEDMEEYLSSLSLSLGSDIEFNASDDCARYETVTPGKLIAAQLQQSVEAPLTKAMNDSATGNTILDSVSNLAAGLITQGITQLIGNIDTTDPEDPTAGGPGNNSEFQSSGDVFVWNTGDTVDLEATPIYVGGVLTGVPSELLQTSIDDTQAELDLLMSSKNLIRDFPKKTMELDQCLPGPDYKFANRMREQYLLESKKVQNKSDNDTENGDEAQDQIKCFDGFISQLISDIKIALISGTLRDGPALGQSQIASCPGGRPWEDVNFPYKNIPSAPIIYDQVNRISGYNDEAGALDAKISSKIRALAILQGIKANIVTYPNTELLNPLDTQSPENKELKDKLASQYVSIESKIGRPDTIADALVEYDTYVDEDYDIFNAANPSSLLSKCLAERTDFASAPMYSDAWHTIVDDNRQTLFCAWEDSWGNFYTQTRGYNDNDFEFECDSWYRGGIDDYKGDAF
ncbi:hypothetical protein IPJ63_01810 [Candidatus Nomurabacteria bacterium]|nr:MAG: hypothetical protein IPJ63_01810 [Candidatus Nomurabacteria bacterium]